MPARTGRRWREVTVPRVLRRDNAICHLCDRPGANTADHLTPWKITHDDSMGNLKAAHVPCNQIRGDRSITWARSEIARRNGLEQSNGWNW